MVINTDSAYYSSAFGNGEAQVVVSDFNSVDQSLSGTFSGLVFDIKGEDSIIVSNGQFIAQDVASPAF